MRSLGIDSKTAVKIALKMEAFHYDRPTESLSDIKLRQVNID